MVNYQLVFFVFFAFFASWAKRAVKAEVRASEPQKSEETHNLNVSAILGLDTDNNKAPLESRRDAP